MHIIEHSTVYRAMLKKHNLNIWHTGNNNTMTVIFG